jgi:hypothetical protein
MIVRLDVCGHTRPFRFWQIIQFQVTINGTVHTIGNPAWIQPLRFDGIADCVRYARIAIFRYLEHRLTEIPEQFEWRIYDASSVRTCPVCQHPLHQTMQLRDVSQWTCAACQSQAHPQPSISRAARVTLTI